MSIHVIGVVALVLVFIIGTLRPVSIGALSLVATFLIGTLVAGESVDELLAGFPAELFVLLVGVTYLFGLASVNGTIEWIIDRAVGLFGDRPALVPWLIFVFSAVPTTAGALGPAAVAMLAPLCLRLGERYGIDRRMSALMVMHGSCLGNFSPLNGLAIIVQRAAAAGGVEVSSAALFFGNAAYNIVLAVVIYLCFGGRKLLRERHGRVATAHATVTASVAATTSTGGVSTITGGGGTGEPGASGGTEPASGSGNAERKSVALRADQAITLLVMAGVGVGALVFDIEIGFLALIAAVALHVVFPKRFDKADKQIVWSVVLLICGVTTLVGAMERYGTVDVVGNGIAGIGVPLLIAFLLCVVGAFTSAFGSSAGLLGVLIPLAVPFLLQGQIGASAMIVALAISATVVDSTPFSSVGALTLANAPERERPALFRTMLGWGMAMVVTAPVLTWLVFILPSSV
ncbi:C4-dicarboxylate ABC transporter [Prauserella marina]|uniref:Di-and tricarboxylate transporter n=1 Tax=Prauserella marina TaxID=530584 RepID=A0A222VP49_9PSEU|nr:SLC13 family permease [Prauserella marina]ASR35696.1 C4-dicarboxylate ABC transporter [Prauserella marina]PWV84427.1 di/tricarboxylate transporter [Prauserella marina]SDC22836.1 Di-and tricarboxylate transporter [Prauserella marina]